MRPEDRVDLFERGMEAFVSGDMDATLRFYAPDVELRASDWMNVGDFRGHEGFREMNRLWNEAWEEWNYEVKNVRAVGERHVVARVLVGGRGRGSGIEINQEVGYVIDVDDDGLASYLEITRDEERALEIAHEREVSN